jgi:hypothetical protein
VLKIFFTWSSFCHSVCPLTAWPNPTDWLQKFSRTQLHPLWPVYASLVFVFVVDGEICCGGCLAFTSATSPLPFEFSIHQLLGITSCFWRSDSDRETQPRVAPPAEPKAQVFLLILFCLFQYIIIVKMFVGPNVWRRRRATSTLWRSTARSRNRC